VQLFHTSAIVGLDISQLPKNTPAGRTLARLCVRATREIAQSIYLAAPPAFEYGRERLKPNQRRAPDRVKAPIVLLTRVCKPTSESIVRPLEQKVGNGVKNRVMIYRFLLELDPAYLAKPVLVMFEDRPRKELVHHLGLSPRECHYTFSVLNHSRSR
jgi:hypothetical protein